MLAGEALDPGQGLVSADGTQTLVVQPDGDLGLYDAEGVPRWAAGTATPGARLTVTPEGDVVLVAPDGSTVWSTGTAGTAGAAFVVRDDGDVVVEAPDGSVAWESGTAVLPSILLPGGELHPGDALTSPDGRHTLQVLDDGDVVLLGPDASTRWSAGTHEPGSSLVLREDGNLVVTDTDGRRPWRTRTAGHPGATLVVQDDGNLVLSAADGTPLWSTGTTGGPGSSVRLEDGAVLLLAATGQELWRVDVPAELLVRRAELATDCTAVDAPVPQSDTVVTSTGVRVHPCLAAAVDELMLAARAEGVDLHAWGWRSREQQIALRAQNCSASGVCYPPTAPPGTSRHERGLALDFTVGGGVVQHGTDAYRWLVEHAPAYGLKNLPSEAWHWSVDGW
nr:D-alanyl-D-alanine carboxypeptidase family protein [Cellulomonas septica]